MSDKKNTKAHDYFSYAEVIKVPVLPFADDDIPGGPLEINENILEIVKKDFITLIENT